MDTNQAPARHGPRYRFCHPTAKTIVGLTAVLAISAFTGLVFGPLADERSLAAAGERPPGRPITASAQAGLGPIATAAASKRLAYDLSMATVRP